VIDYPYSIASRDLDGLRYGRLHASVPVAARILFPASRHRDPTTSFWKRVKSVLQLPNPEACLRRLSGENGGFMQNDREQRVSGPSKITW